MEAPEALYLLEISLKDAKGTGTYHGLKVKVDRPVCRWRRDGDTSHRSVGVSESSQPRYRRG